MSLVLLKIITIFMIFIKELFIACRKMAKLVQGPPRFTHPEWTTSNLTHYANAESERAAAERLVEESKRLTDETAKRTDKTQRDVEKKFG
jgi:tektin-1